MRYFFPSIVSLICLTSPLLAENSPAQKQISLKQGDFWVMAGDSITAQRLHTNFIEAFFRTRYPNQNLKFRNSGIGGNTTGSVLARFGYDIADWKPTIVSIELGMNDVGAGDDPSKYIDGMRQLVKKVREIQATPILISSSPVNDGSALDAWQSDRCRKIHPYTEALTKFAQEEGVLLVDQYHPLLSRWASNKLRADLGRLTSFSASLKSLGLEDTEPGVRELQAFLNTWKGSTHAHDLGGDAVHPGPVGQLTMAATILQNLGIEKDVSAATLTADAKVESAVKCRITDAKAKDGVLTFTRTDESIPWPVPAMGRPALVVMPEIADLSRYSLKITGLTSGTYKVMMNDDVVLQVSAEKLAKGVNLSTVENGPLAVQSNEIYQLITTLQSQLNSQWRDASKAGDTVKLEAAQKEIDTLETKLTAACQPKAIQFTIQKTQ